MRKYLFRLLYLGCIPFIACRNTDPTTGTTLVSGQVVEYNTQQGVPYATIAVYQVSSNHGYQSIGTGSVADATGHFSFDFDASAASGYVLAATAPPGYFTDWVLAPNLKAGWKNDNIIIPTYAPAWVKIQLANDSGRKRYSISITGYSGSGEQIYNPRDTTLVRPLVAGFKTPISWGIVDKQTGAFSQGSQAVQPGALDTATVRIPF